ncbi:LICD protein family superfamily protein [[Clostridium] cellulosi]|jgi:LICD Protein Family.|uniref:LICD protein family superfamily protein n=1 Tax=[Clostridium] cellulosi TaxID=29343 RepID=A0A078KUT9_9FIRM|nr:LICD protein family superfamily protein [[Clostridium] cellulosi]
MDLGDICVHENTLRTLQLEELKILKVIIDICNRHNLRYCLIGGTLLGAVRHKGFIPWDDDIDIGMPRPDYEKFLQQAQKELKEPLAVKCFKFTPNYKYSFARVDTSEIQIETNSTNTKKIENLWVDIFPIDAMPNNKFLSFLHQKRLLFLRLMSKYSVFNEVVGQNKKNRPWYEKALIALGNKINPDRFMDYKKWYTKLDNAYKKYPYETADVVGNLCGVYKMHELVPKSYFEPFKTLEFEGMTVFVPNEYDKYLKHIYGDYMKLPPEDKREQHFAKIIYREDVDK